MQKKRRQLVWMATGVIGAAFVSALLMGALRIAERRHDLLARAVPLAAPEVWQGSEKGSAPPSDGTYTSPFFWRNDHEVLRFAKIGAVKTVRQALILLDLSTGKARSVAGAPPLLPGQRPLSVSPDGKWLLSVDRSASPPHLFAVALDGSGARRTWRPAETNGDIYWFRDNTQFMSSMYDWRRKFSEGRAYRMDDEQPGKAVRLVNMVPGQGVPLSVRNRLFPIGQLPTGRFIGYGTATMNGATKSKLPFETLTEFGIPPGAAPPPRTLTVPAPPPKTGANGILGGALGTSRRLYSSRQAYLSPQGDRLLWMVHTFEFSSGYGAAGGGARGRILTYVYRVLPPRLRPRPSFRDSYDVFTARVDGRGGLTHIGAVAPQELGAKHFHSDVRWTPDGKRVAFLHRGTLYAISAEDR